MSLQEVMQALESMGTPSTKRTLMNHGAREPFFGVKVGDMRSLQKKIKKNYILSLELYNTGNSDAMYLAGLIADEQKMTPADLQHWVEHAYWSMISDYTVAWIAAESKYGEQMAMQWIDSEQELIASAAWCTLSSMAGIKPDHELNIPLFSRLLKVVQSEIHQAPNQVRYSMNGFVIATGAGISALNQQAVEVAQNIGLVQVNMGNTACKVPLATSYLEKIAESGRVGHKKKQARC